VDVSSVIEEQGWSVAEAALLTEVPEHEVRAWASTRRTAHGERVSTDDVVRLAALARFTDRSWLARRRTRVSLDRLQFPAEPHLLVRQPNGVVVAVDPERIVDHLSRPGEFTGFDPAPIRRRLGLGWPAEGADACS
jgi:hypothetical protein